MSQVKRVDTLDIGEDIAFDRRQGTIQRAGWWVILLLLMVGLLGVFGSGYLSHASATAGLLTVEYDRFARQRAPTELTARIDPAALPSNSDQIAIWIDRDFLDAIDLDAIEPDPEASEIGVNRIVYRFAEADDAGPLEITASYQPASVGQTAIRLGLVDGDEISVSQFTFP